MQAYRRGAPPNFRVDPPSIVTHMYVRTELAMQLISRKFAALAFLARVMHFQGAFHFSCEHFLIAEIHMTKNVSMLYTENRLLFSLCGSIHIASS